MAICSFINKKTEQFYAEGVAPKEWRAIANVALRKLDMIQAAQVLTDLRTPPGNRLEALKADRKGQYSIRINDQFRICFRWTAQGAADVEIVDYH